MLSKKALMSTAVAAEALAIEDVFSTYLYTGNGSTQTITNGIDLAGEGGLTWIKSRSAATNHFLFDTLRGTNNEINSNTTQAAATLANSVTAFNASGFSLGSAAGINVNAATYASWTFRQAPRFFDVVTYTGNGATGRQIAHDLGVVPGCIIVKCTSLNTNWVVHHRSLSGANRYLELNTTIAQTLDNDQFGALPTASVFTVGPNSGVNFSGATYVAYLFAHDPLGPSGDGSDGLIACGLHTQAVTDANELINLGWEPQWVLTKRADSSDDWILVDNMRGFLATGNSTMLRPNLANSDGLTTSPRLASNGLVFRTTAGQQHIYIAIRRGPMREPTSGTEVFTPVTRAGTGANATVTAGFVPDLAVVKNRTNGIAPFWASRLTGNNYMTSSSFTAEGAADATILQSNAWDSMTGLKVGTTSGLTNASANNYINYLFRRSKGFFDVVAYTGTGANRTVAHNLGVPPELIIVKKRSAADDWAVYYGDNTDYMLLNSNLATVDDITYWNDTSPTASVFTVGTNTDVNTSSATYISYLFATLPGISKVGTYVGNGTANGQSQTINCGFTTGARFVMIRPLTFGAGWQVFDTARGISGNDPCFYMHSSSAEFSTDNAISPDNTGFTAIRQAATGNTDTNQSGTTYAYLAIA